MEKINITEKDIKESPKDIKVEAVIIEIEKKKLKEIIDPKDIKDDNHDKEYLVIKFEYKYNEQNYIKSDKMPYYEDFNDYHSVGKFVSKYGVLTVGTKCMIDINGKGFAKILLE